MTRGQWRTAARIAWRDLRSSPWQAGWIVLAMAVGIAGIGGVHSAANSARSAIHGDVRAWLAGDACVDTMEAVDRAQSAALDRLGAQGIAWTVVSSAWTMASSEESPDPGVISVKAVDPSMYPFYGALTVVPSQTLREALRPSTVVVSQEVLDRLQVSIGDTIRVAGFPLQIAGRIENEPDRFSGAVGLGMRCILSREAYLLSGIEASGNSVRSRVLLRVPAGTDIRAEERMLEKLFPGGSIREYRGAFRQQTETIISFLSVTAFLALAFGTIGVAVAVRQHTEDRMSSMAIMKMLGGRSQSIALVFIFEIGAMMAVAIFAAVPLSVLIRISVLSLTGRYLALPASEGWDLATIVGSALAGLAAMVPTLAGPAISVVYLRPAEVLRRDTGAKGSNTLASNKWQAYSTGFACLAFTILAVRMLQSWSLAVAMVAGLAGTLGLAWALAAAALPLLRRWSRRLRLHAPLAAHGIASLHRSARRTCILIAALGTSVTLLVATFAAGTAVARAVSDVLPYDQNRLYLARFRDSHQNDVRTFLDRQPGVEHFEIMTQARVQLRSMTIPGAKKIVHFDAPYLSVCDSSVPNGGVAIADDVARKIGASIGARLELEVREKSFYRTVSVIRRFIPAERIWSTLRIDCAGLDSSMLFHQAAVEVKPDHIAEVCRALRVEFPSLAVITADDISETVQIVSRDAMTLARVVTWYALAAGLLMTIAIIAASRSSRLGEIAIFSALGARRAAIVTIYSIEFASIGLLSGLIASLLAYGFTSLTLSVIFQRIETPVEWLPVAAAIGISSAATFVAGWLPSFGLLRKRPMDVIRGLHARS
jgi:putative ABC transport system permease protein